MSHRKSSSIDKVQIEVQLPPGRVQSRVEEKQLIERLQKELDETKIVLHKTIESVLERGMCLLAVCGKLLSVMLKY